MYLNYENVYLYCFIYYFVLNILEICRNIKFEEMLFCKLICMCRCVIGIWEVVV